LNEHSTQSPRLPGVNAVSSPLDLAIPVSGADHVLGTAGAHATVVEYGDFECPIYRQAAPAVKLLLQRFSDQARFAYRHFPLEDPHPHALLAAEAAECAASQGKFWEMHDLIFENQDHLELADLHGYARRLRLDMIRFTKELEGHEHLHVVREHMEGGRRSHIRATPGFFVNGTIVDVSFGMRALFDATEAALTGR
jgi:protein-disulfide isomerase